MSIGAEPSSADKFYKKSTGDAKIPEHRTPETGREQDNSTTIVSIRRESNRENTHGKETREQEREGSRPELEDPHQHP
jgi:hypothetical protein